MYDTILFLIGPKEINFSFTNDRLWLQRVYYKLILIYWSINHNLMMNHNYNTQTQQFAQHKIYLSNEIIIHSLRNPENSKAYGCSFCPYVGYVSAPMVKYITLYPYHFIYFIPFELLFFVSLYQCTLKDNRFLPFLKKISQAFGSTKLRKKGSRNIYFS